MTRKNMLAVLAVFVTAFIVTFSINQYYFERSETATQPTNQQATSGETNTALGKLNEVFRSEDEASPSPTPTLAPIPTTKTLPTDYHIFQTFNNCGPASLSMALDHYGINQSQQVLGQALRPYQNPQGDNDDKSVTLAELADQAANYDLIPYHRPAGTVEIMKQFIAHDMPVITRTWLTADEDIGHYRVVKGYDETQGVLIQDDSLQGANLTYTYAEFNEVWKKFNYEYLVLVPTEKKAIAEQILGEFTSEEYAWNAAREQAERELSQNPSDAYARFNLSVALYHLGEYQQSVAEYEAVASQLPFRTLWYQIEPIQAYAKLGDTSRVFEITDQILNNGNRAFSELYLIRGKIYEEQGNLDAARQEYELAVRYNERLEAAYVALQALN